MRDDQYGYDASGNVTSIDDLLPSNVSKRSMTYDGLDRLKTVTAGISARNTLHNINATTNRLDSITNGPPGFNVTYGYDSRGNVTQRNSQVFEYDLADRLKRAVGRATYTYDGFKRRVTVVGTDALLLLPKTQPVCYPSDFTRAGAVPAALEGAEQWSRCRSSC